MVESDDEQADFDIDSDASDADLLELKQELDKLGPEKAQRDLADATIAAQEMTLQRWKRYVSDVVLSPLDFMKLTAEADPFRFPLHQILRLCTQGSLEIAQVLFDHVLQRLPHLVPQDTPSCPEVEHIRKRVEDFAPAVL